MLSLGGIEVISALGATDSLAQIAQATEAQLNIVLYPEYGRKIARKLETEYQIPYLIPSEGPPIGFNATLAFIRQICARLGTNPEQAIEAIERAQARAYLFLARFSSLLGLPKGALFSIKAEASLAYALAKWLCTYLGMIPAAISVLPEEDSEFREKLEQFLTDINYKHVLSRPIIETATHILLADGSTIAQLKLSGQIFCGIEIALPSLGYLDITEKFLLGGEGALFLLEQFINGLRFV